VTRVSFTPITNIVFFYEDKLKMDLRNFQIKTDLEKNRGII